MRDSLNPDFRPTLLGAGCTSSAGDSVEATWEGVMSGRCFVQDIDPAAWTVAPRFQPRACLWKTPAGGESISVQDLLVRQTLIAFREAFAELPESARSRVRDGTKLGVILATTKGSLDDEIWKDDPKLDRDFFTPLLTEVLRVAELSPLRMTCVSNACASSLSAIGLAQTWLSGSEIDDVLVLAADRIGPFVLHGFHSLRAVTSNIPRPFAADRSGLLLGEGSAALFLSKFPGEFRISGVGIDAEGFAVTRPEKTGGSLHAACMKALDPTSPPDLVIAHGTATEVNDPVEALVLSELFPKADVPITASKGALGHTLGASGAIDLILAREAIRRGEGFSISQTTTIDPGFTGNFLVSPSPDSVARVSGNFRRVLVTSLGFGGIHGAVVLERVPVESVGSTTNVSPTANSPAAPLETSDTHSFRFPVKVAPDWAPSVERWYQLDASAFGMADAAYTWKKDPRPEVLFLASPGGSNVTDAEFASTGARSPALFVHSLPNVRSSSFCQVLNWHGPLYCLQIDPDPFSSAVEEARRHFRVTGKSAWVLGVENTGGRTLLRRFRVMHG